MSNGVITPNEMQQKAIDILKGQVMLLAGPGTGKTFTVINRIEKMLADGIDPSSILCLTYSDAAANEMRQRLIKKMGVVASSVDIYTYHSFCNDIIKTYPSQFNLSVGVRVINDTEKIAIMKECIDEVPLQFFVAPRADRYYFTKNFISHIEKLKTKRITKEKYHEYILTNPTLTPRLKELESEIYEREQRGETRNKGRYQEVEKIKGNIERAKELWALYEAYSDKMINRNLIDFSDMITFVLDEFENDIEFLKEVSNKYTYFLVDEYQDTNDLQNAIIFNLVEGNKKLMFNIHEIEDDYDVFVAFETMNNRGKKLTNLELLKNRLIYLTTLYSDATIDEYEKNSLRNDINETWKEVYYQLGRNESIPLSDDEFLRAHWIIYFAYSRQKGNDYIKFLLNKFSAKNIFEKQTVLNNSEDEFVENEEDEQNEDDFTTDEEFENEPETITISKLSPNEIKDYINSLKDMAKYWYDTFFPRLSPNLSTEEQKWIDKLNRIGIGHFRPLVAVIISLKNVSSDIKIRALKAIERFIFLCFRCGYFNATFRSSEYYRMTRSLYFKEATLEDFIDDIENVTASNIKFAIPNFINKIEKHFDDKDGYYSWNTIKYFLYEYEFSLAQTNNIDKVSWEMFTKSEKDKVSIEHIFPQTPTKYYWRNTYRQFDDNEKKLLAGALGNLLPLSQSINSSLQNDSFEDKKSPSEGKRRGYENGSHSEIEVSKEKDWTASNIYNRSKQLLQFMEKRWDFNLTPEQLDRLIYINFVNDGRQVPDELPEEEEIIISDDDTESYNGLILENELEKQQFLFWTNFVNYCQNKNRTEITGRKPRKKHWYNIGVGASGFHLSFTLSRNKYITLLIYTYTIDVFNRLEQNKTIIENAFGDKLEWYTSRENSKAKRILYRHEANIFDIQSQPEIFEWMIEHYDKLCKALSVADEIDL